MGEAEWLRCDDPQEMLIYLHRLPGEKVRRKLRLWCLACRHASGRGTGATLYQTIDRTDGKEGGDAFSNAMSWASPQFDGAGDPLLPARADLLREIIGNPFRPVIQDCATVEDARGGVCWHHDCGLVKVEPALWMCPQGRGWFRRFICTPQVLSLAQAAYDERNEDGTLDRFRLCLLADALEEAGLSDEQNVIAREAIGYTCPRCGDVGFWRSGQEFDHMKKCSRSDCGAVWVPDDEVKRLTIVSHPLLAHLRNDETHVRGCWAVDLVLGKE